MQVVNESAILFLLAAVQFVNIIDFMMVIPMGPFFAQALAIPTSHIGFVGGSYTAAAALSSVVCATFLDRFDRRTALAFTMLGLVLATAAGGLAVNLQTLLAARVAAGVFGGPAAALTLSIIADVIPLERRGRAMGVIMTSFAVASVLGVPTGLYLAEVAGWRAPFFGVAALGLLVAGAAVFALPSLTGHLSRDPAHEGSMGETLGRPLTWLALSTTFLTFATMFALVPNFAAYIVYNAHYPQNELGRLYMFGGLVTLLSTRLIGKLVDRFGSTSVAATGALLFSVVIYQGFVMPPNTVPTMAFFIGWMLAASVRNIPWNALTTKIPRANERARFMSLNSAVQHVACSAGAFAAAQYLTEAPDHSLIGIDRVALVAIAAGLLQPVMTYVIEKQVAA